jgi:fructokinase
MIKARIATAGEALIDLVAEADERLRPCMGGAVYNLSRALARQAVPTCYLNPFSGDRFGQLLAKQFEADGGLLAQSQAVAQPSSLAVVSVDGARQPQYAFYREGVADRAVTSTTLIAATQSISQLEIAATGCLALVPEDRLVYHPWLQSSRQAGIGVAIDINMRPAVVANPKAYRASVLQAISFADLLKASNEDLDFLFDGIEDPLQAAQALFELSPAQWVALTLGSEGAYLFARDGRSWHGLDHANLNIVDTVGAGDCFLAGLLSAMLGANPQESVTLASPSGLTDEGHLYAALSRAIASASYCIQHSGCEPPDSQQIEAHLKRETIKLQAFASGQTPVR